MHGRLRCPASPTPYLIFETDAVGVCKSWSCISEWSRGPDVFSDFVRHCSYDVGLALTPYFFCLMNHL